MTQNDDRLISALEVAYRTGLHPATIYRKALRGDIPGLVKLGKTVRFREPGNPTMAGCSNNNGRE